MSEASGDPTDLEERGTMKWLLRLRGGDRRGAQNAIESLLASGHKPVADELVETYQITEAGATAMIEGAAKPRLSDYIASTWKADRFDRREFHDYGESLGLSADVIRAAIFQFATAKVEEYVAAILADGLIDPAEDATLNSLLGRLGIALGPESTAMIASARDLWQVSNAPLPIGRAPILLKRGEICHHVVATRACADRQRAVRTNYAGPSARIRLIKGVYYTVGSIQHARETVAYEHEIGFGVLCLTNMRLLWISSAKTISIPLQKIIKYELYSDAVRIFKDTGKPLMFYWIDGVNKRSSVLTARVIEELR